MYIRHTSIVRMFARARLSYVHFITYTEEEMQKMYSVHTPRPAFSNPNVCTHCVHLKMHLIRSPALSTNMQVSKLFRSLFLALSLSLYKIYGRCKSRKTRAQKHRTNYARQTLVNSLRLDRGISFITKINIFFDRILEHIECKWGLC